MMAGMAIGGAFGQNIAGMVNSSMNPASQPIPVTIYYVAQNGKATGPFDMNTLSQMCQSGTVNAETLVWKTGMTDWMKAVDVAEISGIVGVIAPEE